MLLDTGVISALALGQVVELADLGLLRSLIPLPRVALTHYQNNFSLLEREQSPSLRESKLDLNKKRGLDWRPHRLKKGLRLLLVYR